MALGLVVIVLIGVVGIVGLFAAGFMMNRPKKDRNGGDR